MRCGMYSEDQMFSRLTAILRSPVDAKAYIDEYSNELLQHAMA